jgi:hypothetical protein
MSLTLYIIYNNSKSFFGKIGYNFRRMSATAESGSACAASDLTHGGDLEHEKPEWQQLKKQIPASIVQSRYDEVASDVWVDPRHACQFILTHVIID